MRSKKSGLDNAPTTEGKAESPDESVKAGQTDLSRRKVITRVGLVATLLAIGGQVAIHVSLRSTAGAQMQSAEPRKMARRAGSDKERAAAGSPRSADWGSFASWRVS